MWELSKGRESYSVTCDLWLYALLESNIKATKNYGNKFQSELADLF